jgi:DNA-binding XRE family transcriptional regulator
MKKTKRRALDAAGWRVGTTQEFLGLSAAEVAFIETKLALAHYVRTRREAKGLTQTQLAKLIGSSQSRVAKMEAGDPEVSMDLLVHTLFEIGLSRSELARAIGQRSARRAA